MQTETLLLILLATGLLIVIVLFAAILWVILTMLFKVRRVMMKTRSAAKSGAAVLKFIPALPLALVAALIGLLKPDEEEGKS